MSRLPIYETLKNHYEFTRKRMEHEELIRTFSKASPCELMAGRRLFDQYLDFQKGGAT